MFCPACGAAVTAGSAFCGSCGAGLAAIRQVPQVPPTAATPASVTVPYGGFWIRVAALAVDTFVIVLFWVVLVVLAGLSALGPGIPFIAIVGTFLGPFAYYAIFTAWRGQTLGKIAVGLRVVDEHNRHPDFARAVLRETLGKFVSWLVFGIGFLTVAWDGKKQGWHDRMAQTYVVRTRS